MQIGDRRERNAGAAPIMRSRFSAVCVIFFQARHALFNWPSMPDQKSGEGASGRACDVFCFDLYIESAAFGEGRRRSEGSLINGSALIKPSHADCMRAAPSLERHSSLDIVA